MDVVYRLEEASAAEVRERLADPPSYSAVRATLRILEQKGYLKHRKEGPRYVYAPTVSRRRARRHALRRLLDTFFEGSTEAAVAALLERPKGGLSPDELTRIARRVRRAQRESGS
jgi:predicted transcriptional regulator